MSNLTVRLITAGVAAPVLIGLVYWPHAVPLWGLVFAATAVGLYEWSAITLGGRPRGERLVGVVLGLGLAAAVYFGGQTAQLLTLAGVTLAGFAFYLFRYGDLPTAGARFGTTLAGALYVGVLLTFLALPFVDQRELLVTAAVALSGLSVSDDGKYLAYGRSEAGLLCHAR